MGTDFLPAREAELVTWSANFSQLINATPIAYGLSAPQAAAYEVLHEAMVQAHQVANNPMTRSPANIVTKNTAKRELIASARQLAGIIQSHPATTDTQRAELGLTVRSIEPTPVPRPAVAPGADIIAVSGRRVSVNIHDSASSSKRGKPAGAVAAWIYSHVGQNYPADPAAWTVAASTTRARHEIVFPSAIPGGARVWICAAWINAKQEAGPLSTPIATQLQGGGEASPELMKIAA